ncbi:polyprenyl synthetase family protein [Peptoniphilus catoniae]|uniref:polyprenyl synthetase family protein n=1 Tax=Peptoniphilus catoniae TaxID=1660341 RepID=UPI0010FF50C6|nr:polyprenyl synthetase family protein [Peptoniphilus catoniae]
MKNNEDLIELIDNSIFKNFSVIDDYQKVVYESMIYSLSSGGKRVRPILCLLTYAAIKDEDWDGDYEKVLPYAVAMELIHTYSLIHDDLPAMDNDDLRRGKPTNHKVYSEAIAILAGDGLLNMSAEILSKNLEQYLDEPEDLKRAVKAMKYIFNASGTHGMIGGQVIDLNCGEDTEIDIFENMYKLKTAALIRTSIVSGAIMAGAVDEEIASLEEFSNCIGIAYQIKDDLIDEDLDDNKNKSTISNHKTKEELEERINNLTLRAKEELKNLKHNTDSLEKYVDMLVARRS